ncbi:MAG TPA: hypothetical protein VLA02_00255, partial [Reyranella sp.]|nr:hypothetical protein [Reyranella sp.]
MAAGDANSGGWSHDWELHVTYGSGPGGCRRADHRGSARYRLEGDGERQGGAGGDHVVGAGRTGGGSDGIGLGIIGGKQDCGGGAIAGGRTITAGYARTVAGGVGIAGGDSTIDARAGS